MRTIEEKRTQAMEALALANSVRISNKHLCNQIHALRLPLGCDRAVEVLRGDMKGPGGSLPTSRLLYAVRHLGDSRVRRALHAAQVVDATRPLRRLSTRQRELLATHLEDIAACARARVK